MGLCERHHAGLQPPRQADRRRVCGKLQRHGAARVPWPGTGSWIWTTRGVPCVLACAFGDGTRRRQLTLRLRPKAIGLKMPDLWCCPNSEDSSYFVRVACPNLTAVIISANLHRWRISAL
jgi:hypothetical protein